MIKSRIIAFFSLLCLGISTAQAFIVKIDILKGKNPKTGQEQHIYLLSDIHGLEKLIPNLHNKVVQIAHTQKNALLSMLDKCDKNRTKVFVEDVASYLGAKVDAKGKRTNQLKKQNQQFLLPYLCCIIKNQLNMECINIEGDRFGHDLDFNYNRSFEDLLQPALTFAQEVKNYDDGDKFNKYYKSIAKEIQYNSVRITTLGNNMAALYKNYPGQAFRLSILLPKFDQELLDAKAIHEIINSGHKNKIFVIAGAMHIANIKKVLEKLNYRLLTTQESSMSEFTESPMINVKFGKLLVDFEKGQTEQYDPTDDQIKKMKTMLKLFSKYTVIMPAAIKSLSQDPLELSDLHKQEKQLLSLDGNTLFPIAKSHKKLQNQIDYYAVIHKQ